MSTQTIGDRIRECRLKLGLSGAELAKKVGIPKSTMFRYEGAYSDNIPIDIIRPLAQVLQTTPEYLMGWDEEEKKPKKNIYDYANVYPLEPYVKLPVLGIIRAGQPICTDQNSYDDWEFADAKYNDGEHYMLRVQGDSMSPTIPSGSIAIIRVQNTAEKGQIVAFALDGEYATLKRYFPQPDGSILLRADNPNADSYVVTQEQIKNNEAFILGICRSYKVNL